MITGIFTTRNRRWGSGVQGGMRLRSEPRRSHLYRVAPVIALGMSLSVLTACTDDPIGSKVGEVPPAGAWQLVAYESCQDAIESLREAAKSVVGPYGFSDGPGFLIAEMDSGALPPAPGMPDRATAPEAQMTTGQDSGRQAGPAPGRTFSGTNTHESGVDEPDIIKTDGRRIVTISGGVLRVTDAATMTLSSFLNLTTATREPIRYSPADLLLHGDHALVLLHQAYPVEYNELTDLPKLGPEPRPKLLLVDLAGQPRIISELTVDGRLLDARQSGSLARVVVRSSPRLSFPYEQQATEAELLERNKKIIDDAELDDWLPRIEVTTGGRTEPTEIGCSDVSRPAEFSSTSMLTILTIDLTGTTLQETFPSVLFADGDTVYSNGQSLYVANDQRWRLAWPSARGDVAGRPAGPIEPRTEIYKFDTSRPGRPEFVAGGAVPGYLLNQYALSEWDGHLRVATTTQGDLFQPRGGPPVPDERVQRPAEPESAVYVLAQRGGSLVEVGSVTGLGKGERIYAVRFTGALGYVVTFRQTDPLYTLDLSAPTAPRLVGELKIAGYSAYLHPAGSGRLIGVGQDATDTGRITGTQVSLFDVGDLAHPTRLAQYHLSGAHSEAEFDPHAFLYWPAEALLVVPVQSPRAVTFDSLKERAASGAVVLRVGTAGISEVGFLQHPESPVFGTRLPIRRSLVIDQTLWTMSEAGLMATDVRTLARLAWVPFG